MSIASGKLTKAQTSYILKEFSKKECELRPGETAGKSEKYYRKCKVYLKPFSEMSLLYNILYDIFLDKLINIEYDIAKCEKIEFQYTVYDVGDLYNRHQDVVTKKHDKTSRAFTMSINLNDDYVGGDLICYDRETGEEHVLSKEPGSWILFPSIYKHEVKPVTLGTRKALVIWKHIDISEYNRYMKDAKNNPGYNILQ